MSDNCESADHDFSLYRERELLWCAKCGLTKGLDSPRHPEMVFNVTVPAKFDVAAMLKRSKLGGGA